MNERVTTAGPQQQESTNGCCKCRRARHPFLSAHGTAATTTMVGLRLDLGARRWSEIEEFDRLQALHVACPSEPLALRGLARNSRHHPAHRERQQQKKPRDSCMWKARRSRAGQWQPFLAAGPGDMAPRPRAIGQASAISTGAPPDHPQSPRATAQPLALLRRKPGLRRALPTPTRSPVSTDGVAQSGKVAWHTSDSALRPGSWASRMRPSPGPRGRAKGGHLTELLGQTLAILANIGIRPGQNSLSRLPFLGSEGKRETHVAERHQLCQLSTISLRSSPPAALGLGLTPGGVLSWQWQARLTEQTVEKQFRCLLLLGSAVSASWAGLNHPDNGGTLAGQMCSPRQRRAMPTGWTGGPRARQEEARGSSLLRARW